MRDLAEHLCHADTRIAAMMAPEKRLSKKMKLEAPPCEVKNSLNDALLAYTATPEAAMEESGDSKKAAEGEAKPTVEQVKSLLVTHGLATKNDIGRVNRCLKAAVLHRHYTITEATNEETLLHEGGCYCCGQTLQVTWGKALFQTCYAGCDYEDGGQDAAIQCDSCGGNYITGLCEGRAEFDSGKFHNHCEECPDFWQVHSRLSQRPLREL